jgi:DNA-binding transcriptional LysR family regulator
MLPSRGKLAADLSEFKLAFLKVDIEITELPPLRQKEAILAGQLDLGYTYGFQYTQEREFAVDRIATWPWSFAMHSGHRLMRRRAISVEDLHGEALSLMRPTPATTESASADTGRGAVYRASRAKQGDRVDPRRGWYGAGLGAGFAEAVRIPNVVYRPFADSSANWELVLVSRRTEPSAAVQRFIEIARTPRIPRSIGLQSRLEERNGLSPPIA